MRPQRLRFLCFLFCAVLIPALAADPVRAELPASALKMTGFGAMTRIRRMLSYRSWDALTPYVRPVAIESSRDGSSQMAMYYDSGSDRKKPLLVVLHSWSHYYNQKVSLPYAVWARNNDWVFISPDYRGRFNSPLALSDLARRDILDAVKYARRNANVDARRIYLAGYSGGATMGLLMALKHKNLFAAVVAWSPVYDLNLWYRDIQNHGHYPYDVSMICGGIPLETQSARDECSRRSPARYLSQRALGRTQVYIGTGIRDNFVSPIHALAAYNQVVAPERQVDVRVLYERRPRLDLQLNDDHESGLYARAGRPLLLARDEGPVSLRIYYGRHDVIYDAGLYWLSRKKKPPGFFARMFGGG